MSSERPVRVRFAPSPTGKLHIGGARTALFNWAFARRHGGAFLLRVEDTDAERNTEAALRSILDSLRWLGLGWDEGPEAGGAYGPYFQSQRRGHYDAAIERLLGEGRLYRHFVGSGTDSEPPSRDSRQPARFTEFRELDPAESQRRADGGEPHLLRFKVPLGRDVEVPDLIRGGVCFRSDEVEDWVAVRSNGMPTYNFVCVVDDAAMQISHVLRGEEHLVNTPKQVLLYEALGEPAPRFAHVPLILGGDGKKLSKRTGDTALDDYRAKGYGSEALFNFLALLGFSIDDKTTVFDRRTMVEHFDLARINKSGAIFDLDKLHWLCGEYVRRAEPSALTDAVMPFLREAGQVSGSPSGEDRAWLERVVASMQERFELYAELPEKIAWLFGETVSPDPKAATALRAAETPRVLDAIAARLEAEQSFPPADFDAWIKQQAVELELGLGKLMKPMRAALSGTLGGPPVADILALLGRDRALARLRGAVPAAEG